MRVSLHHPTQFIEGPAGQSNVFSPLSDHSLPAVPCCAPTSKIPVYGPWWHERWLISQAQPRKRALLCKRWKRSVRRVHCGSNMTAALQRVQEKGGEICLCRRLCSNLNMHKAAWNGEQIVIFMSHANTFIGMLSWMESVQHRNISVHVYCIFWHIDLRILQRPTFLLAAFWAFHQRQIFLSAPQRANRSFCNKEKSSHSYFPSDRSSISCHDSGYIKFIVARRLNCGQVLKSQHPITLIIQTVPYLVTNKARSNKHDIDRPPPSLPPTFYLVNKVAEFNTTSSRQLPPWLNSAPRSWAVLSKRW